MSAKSAGLTTKNPFAITIPEWLAMAPDEERRAAASKAKELAKKEMGGNWLAGGGEYYMLFCGIPMHVRAMATSPAGVPSTKAVAEFAELYDCVPFEFFADAVPLEEVEQRWQDLNAALGC